MIMAVEKASNLLNNGCSVNGPTFEIFHDIKKATINVGFTSHAVEFAFYLRQIFKSVFDFELWARRPNPGLFLLRFGVDTIVHEGLAILVFKMIGCTTPIEFLFLYMVPVFMTLMFYSINK